MRPKPAAGALHARLRVVDQPFLADRGDVFYEHVAEDAVGSADLLAGTVGQLGH